MVKMQNITQEMKVTKNGSSTTQILKKPRETSYRVREAIKQLKYSGVVGGEFYITDPIVFEVCSSKLELKKAGGRNQYAKRPFLQHRQQN